MPRPRLLQQLLAVAVVGLACAHPSAAAQDPAKTLALRYAPVVRLVAQSEPCAHSEAYEPTDVNLVLGNPGVALHGPWNPVDIVKGRSARVVTSPRIPGSSRSSTGRLCDPEPEDGEERSELVVRWSLAAPVIALESKSWRAALRRSSQLVRGDWWRVASLVGFVTVTGLLSGPLLGAILLFVTSASFNFVNLVSALVYVFALPFVAISTTYLYFDLAVEKEQEEPQPVAVQAPSTA